MPGLESFARTLPTVELHLHLIGSAAPETTGEYLAVARLAGLDPAGVVRLAENGIRARYLEPAAKAALLAELAATAAEHGGTA